MAFQKWQTPFGRPQRHEGRAGKDCQTVQTVCDDLDKAFQAFFRRVKAGETPCMHKPGDATWAGGRTMTPEQAVALALELGDPSTLGIGDQA